MMASHQILKALLTLALVYQITALPSGIGPGELHATPSQSASLRQEKQPSFTAVAEDTLMDEINRKNYSSLSPHAANYARDMWCTWKRAEKLQFIRDHCSYGTHVGRYTREGFRWQYEKQVKRREDDDRELDRALKHPKGITDEELKQLQWEVHHFAKLHWPRYNQKQREEFLRQNPSNTFKEEEETESSSSRAS